MNMITKTILRGALAATLITIPAAYANDVPVEQLSSGNAPRVTSPVDGRALTSTEAKMLQLGQQLSNITNMNFPQQINGLRKEIQKLNGRIQVQQHEIKVLSSQQRTLYKDLNHRVQLLSQPTKLTVSPSTQPIAKAPLSSVKRMTEAPKARANLNNTTSQDALSYHAAFNLLSEKKYDDAINAFNNYINKNPKGAFLANAYYWLGEVYLKQQRTKTAIEAFNHAIEDYPHSPKVPDARFKLAIIHITQGKTDEARQELQIIQKAYPNTRAAQLATAKLEDLK
jgi:tol-pal system protein YbgF